MKYIDINNCIISGTSLMCPACQRTLLQKITQKSLQEDDNFKYFFICPNSSCHFIGSPDVKQTTTIYRQLTNLAITTVDFSVSSLSGYDPFSAVFTAYCYNVNVAYYTWDFGDGNTQKTSTDTVSQTYTDPGQYTVTLSVFDTISRETITVRKTELIVVRTYIAPIASFTVDKTSGQNKLTCTFTDTSVGSGLKSWLWDFGDGNTSTIQNPIHTYSAPGKYSVSLTIKNDKAMTNGVTRPNLISILLTAPVASFTASRTSGYIPMDVTFVYDAIDSYFVDTYLWSFGDGTTSTEQNPTHTYTVSGIYDVQLEVHNSVGSDAVLKKNAIVVQNPNISG